MSVTERVMAAGSWDITLSGETPRRLLEAINVEKVGFSTLVILPAVAREPSHALRLAARIARG